MKKLFGTDGVRGMANVEPLTAETTLKIGRAAGYLFKQDLARNRIVIGKDTRLSGYMLESALTSGICSMGMDVVLVGPLPTPGIAFLTTSLRASAGIMISASHNTYEDNGIKIFSPSGHKLPDAMERQIEELIASGKLDVLRPTAAHVGKAHRDDDAIGRYVEFIKNSFPKGMTLDGMRIVLDCANGAAYAVAPKVFHELGAELTVLNDKPDGTNINRNCGATHPDIICNAVSDNKADVGISLDGDADRLIMADEKGNVVDGDGTLAICALDLLRENKLRNRTLVGTLMSNLGLEIAMTEAGATLVRTAVGDRYVLEEMIRGDFNLGGEQSGHVIFRDYTTTGDGLISALQVLAVMRKTGKPLSALSTCMRRMPQVLCNVRVKEKIPFDKMPDILQAQECVIKKLGSKGRLLLRYSGTENIARVMLEGTDQNTINKLAKDLANVIQKNIGIPT